MLTSATCRAQELFVRYYDTMMPMLKQILHASMDRKSHRRLCGKALECISLIAMSVGKDIFYNDARDFMNVLATLNSTDLQPDDPILTYVQTAGTRMCRCLGHEFVPMLPNFVPPLLKSAGKKSELTVRRRHLRAARIALLKCQSQAFYDVLGAARTLHACHRSTLLAETH
jgi:importin-5